VPKSVLEAIRLGIWNFEPPELSDDDYEGSDAMPGTPEKLQALAHRVQSGVPLWHPADRYDVESPPVRKPR
jgi:hypothetical protein